MTLGPVAGVAQLAAPAGVICAWQMDSHGAKISIAPLCSMSFLFTYFWHEVTDSTEEEKEHSTTCCMGRESKTKIKVMRSIWRYVTTRS